MFFSFLILIFFLRLTVTPIAATHKIYSGNDCRWRSHSYRQQPPSIPAMTPRVSKQQNAESGANLFPCSLHASFSLLSSNLLTIKSPSTPLLLFLISKHMSIPHLYVRSALRFSLLKKKKKKKERIAPSLLSLSSLGATANPLALQPPSPPPHLN